MAESWPERIRWLVHRYADGIQAEFARRIGMSTTHLSESCAGLAKPGTQTIEGILARLRKLDFHYTPKHCLDQILVLAQKCLQRRIPDPDSLRREIAPSVCLIHPAQP